MSNTKADTKPDRTLNRVACGTELTLKNRRRTKTPTGMGKGPPGIRQLYPRNSQRPKSTMAAIREERISGKFSPVFLGDSPTSFQVPGNIPPAPRASA